MAFCRLKKKCIIILDQPVRAEKKLHSRSTHRVKVPSQSVVWFVMISMPYFIWPHFGKYLGSKEKFGSRLSPKITELRLNNIQIEPLFGS